MSSVCDVDAMLKVLLLCLFLCVFFSDWIPFEAGRTETLKNIYLTTL